MKTIMSLDNGGILKLIYTPSLYRRLGLPQEAPVLMGQRDKEFPRRHLRADYLLDLLFAHRQILNHFEFQNEPDPHMAVRVHLYQGAAYEEYRLPVLSTVLNVHTRARKAVVLDRLWIGPRSHTTWVTLSVPALVQGWPQKLTSPMAIVLRALTAPTLLLAVRGCLQQLRGLGWTWLLVA